MSAVAVLGSGSVGATLAAGLARAGHSVLIGSREPGLRAAQAGALTAAGVRFTGSAEAAGAADVVVNATPGEASVALLGDLEPQLRGRVLLDVANSARRGPDGFPVAPLHPQSSLAEEIQRALPRTAVVKSLNTMDSAVMVDPRILSSPPTAFLAGDDAPAKAAVAALLDGLGWPQEWILDLGGLYNARALEWNYLMLGPFVRAHGLVPFSLAITH